MKSFLMVGLIMLASISCGFWKKHGKRIVLNPPNNDIAIDVENDVKNKVLRFNVTYKTKTLYQSSQLSMLVYNSSKSSVRTIISANRTSVPQIGEKCTQKGRDVKDKDLDVNKYLVVISSTKKYQNATYVYNIQYERKYGKGVGKCGEVGVKAGKFKYRKGITYTTMLANGLKTTKTYDMDVNFKSGLVLRSAMALILVILGLYLL